MVVSLLLQWYSALEPLLSTLPVLIRISGLLSVDSRVTSDRLVSTISVEVFPTMYPPIEAVAIARVIRLVAINRFILNSPFLYLINLLYRLG